MSETHLPAWRPNAAAVGHANLTGVMSDLGFDSYEGLYRWSIESRSEFWEMVIDRLGIVFAVPPSQILDGSPDDPVWLAGARMNIVDSCFTAPDAHTAVVYRRNGVDHRMSYEELRALVDRFANGLTTHGIRVGDRVAIAMPMTIEAVAAYLGTVAVGAVVVSIADSFAPHEIATRLRLTDPKITITQDRFERSGRDLPMYGKVIEAEAARCVVVETGGGVTLRDGDISWARFLGDDRTFTPVPGPPNAFMNILFSSGTTGEPKGIPWTHLTPIKGAMDGYFHHDIHGDDTVAWPTNLGWMLGPWLIYATLINGAAMALYDDAPTGRGFIDFVRETGVTVLGLVPSIVAVWRSTGALDDAGWTEVRVLSSSGEASVPEDYAWLMETAGGVPVIEYCGGTEIGGGYLIGTVLDDAVPAMFTTPTLGLDVRILDEEGQPADEGELFVVPPSIGLSQELLDRDHRAVYYEGLPESDVPLRRHGDHMEQLPGGYYRALGRVDDAMNLGGIKVSSAEIERTVGGIAGVAEVAAVAVPPPGGGPSRLVVYAVPSDGTEPDPDGWKGEMQQALRSELNPLFRIQDVVIIDELPRTASAKVMRRELRERYQ
ncbi:MAG: AMP-binding protein [Actinomycetota bacterium]|nr:AMP-binding protein [Actinomycetota bacterium]